MSCSDYSYYGGEGIRAYFTCSYCSFYGAVGLEIPPVLRKLYLGYDLSVWADKTSSKLLVNLLLFRENILTKLIRATSGLLSKSDYCST